MSERDDEQKVLTNSIGKNQLTTDRRARKNYERKIMIGTGILEPWFDGPMFDANDFKDLKMCGDRFSTMYETYEEYQRDRQLVGNIVFNGGYAPEELANKVAHTTNEIYYKVYRIGDTP